MNKLNALRKISAQTSSFFLRQLFDKESSTYTYLLADTNALTAILIDPVLEQVERDTQLITELGFDLKYAWQGPELAEIVLYCLGSVNTHVHADHITGTGLLKKKFPSCKSAISAESGALADVHLHQDDQIKFGQHILTFRSTPGHTNGCVTYVCDEQGVAFTGDALLIRGCGRTDFQEGDARTLYQSVHSQILSLPDHFRLYPAHDYKGLSFTTVWEEKQYNARLTKTESEFINIMNNLNLPYPKKIGMPSGVFIYRIV